MRAEALLKTAIDYSTKCPGKTWAWQVLIAHEKCFREDLRLPNEDQAVPETDSCRRTCAIANYAGGSTASEPHMLSLLCRDKGQSTKTKQEHYVAALMQRKLDCRNWRLVLTGHSLGAGAAALIALHLSGRFLSEACCLSQIDLTDTFC